MHTLVRGLSSSLARDKMQRDTRGIKRIQTRRIKASTYLPTYLHKTACIYVYPCKAPGITIAYENNRYLRSRKQTEIHEYAR